MPEYCGAKTRSGGTCRIPAGRGTDHLGEGKCKLHGGANPIKHGRYSKYAHTYLKEQVTKLEEQGFKANDLEQAAMSCYAMLYKLLDNSGGMLSLKVINSASDLLERISRIIARSEKIKSEGAISIETFKKIMEQMAIVVSQHVDDADTLRRIERDWGNIKLPGQ